MSSSGFLCHILFCFVTGSEKRNVSCIIFVVPDVCFPMSASLFRVVYGKMKTGVDLLSVSTVSLH